MRCGVERCHLQGDQRIASASDGVTHDAVHVPFVHQRARVAVIGAQDKAAGVEALFGHSRDLGFDVVPGGPKTQH